MKNQFEEVLEGLDKREEQRIIRKSRDHLFVKLVSEDGEEIDGTIVDISDKGCCINVRFQHLLKGSKCFVSLKDHDNFEGQKLNVVRERLGQVVWCKNRNVNSTIFSTVGITF